MPYDKDGKYYRLPTNSTNKDKEQTTNKALLLFTQGSVLAPFIYSIF